MDIVSSPGEKVNRGSVKNIAEGKNTDCLWSGMVRKDHVVERVTIFEAI